MENYILLIYPIIILGILLFGCKLQRSNNFNENAWSINQAKALQACSALMIILHHLVQAITRYGDIDKGPINIWNYFGILFTSVFFFFSGYGLYKSYKSKNNYLDGFLKKHLAKLLIPFLLTNVLYLLTISQERVFTIRHIFTSIIGITLMNTNAWFLIELIILYIAFYFCFSRIRSEDKAFYVLTGFTVLMIILAMLLGHDHTSVNGHWFMGEWWYNATIVFIMGILIAKKEKSILDFTKTHYKLLLSLSVIVLVLCFKVNVLVVESIGYYEEWKFHPGYPEKLITLLVQMILCIVFMIVVLLASLKLEYKNPVIKRLGGFGLEIYLIHDIFVQTLYNEDSSMPEWEYFLLAYLFALICAFLLSLVDKFLFNFFSDNEEDFLCIKYKKVDPKLAYETKAKILKKRKLIGGIKIVYLIVFVGMILTEAYALYDYSVLNGKRCDNELEELRKADINDRVYFGQYMLDYKKREEEPIPWIVIDKTEDHIMLLSEQILANSEYHNYHQETDWLESKLCRILNHDFYEMAFSNEERQILSGRKEASDDWKIDDKAAFEYYINKEGKYDEEDIHVKSELVFLLNSNEASKYMPDDSDRIAFPSEAAKLEGLGNINTEYRTRWWLTDLSQMDCSAKFVDENGHINDAGKVINNKGIGVRPAIWLDLR